MISSELPEILGMSDRIAVMHGGRIVGILDRAGATQEAILELALGHTGKTGQTEEPAVDQGTRAPANARNVHLARAPT